MKATAKYTFTTACKITLNSGRVIFATVKKYNGRLVTVEECTFKRNVYVLDVRDCEFKYL